MSGLAALAERMASMPAVESVIVHEDFRAGLAGFERSQKPTSLSE
jgi:hypothetical protein